MHIYWQFLGIPKGAAAAAAQAEECVRALCRKKPEEWSQGMAWEWQFFWVDIKGTLQGTMGLNPKCRGSYTWEQGIQYTGKWVDRLNFSVVFLLIWRGLPMGQCFVDNQN